MVIATPMEATQQIGVKLLLYNRLAESTRLIHARIHGLTFPVLFGQQSNEHTILSPVQTLSGQVVTKELVCCCFVS